MEDKKLTLAPEVEEPETAEDTNELYIKFAKPYIFGDKTYTGIDLSGLEDVNGAVLKEAGRVGSETEQRHQPRHRGNDDGVCRLYGAPRHQPALGLLLGPARS